MIMNIRLNGKKEEIDRQMSIVEFLKSKDIRPEVVTVELNEKILEKSKYGDTYIKDKDVLEFVYYMGGGYAF